MTAVFTVQKGYREMITPPSNSASNAGANLLHTNTSQSGGPQFRAALECLTQVFLDGLHHGFFRYAMSSEIGKGNRRELIIEAGKSHKYTIPEDELPR